MGLTTWILGAPDPEMEAIEAVLRAHGQTVAHAVEASGRRVSPGTAYAAVGPDVAGPAVTVECGGGPTWVHGTITRVDHHRPGDPGHGRPAAEYLEASSLGQVLARLGVTATAEQRLVAAADHCLAAAYRAECPGVDPETLGLWRAASRAAFQHRPVADVLRDVDAATGALRAAPRLALGGEEIADLRGLPGGTVPEAPEASARTGLGFLARVVDRDGRFKAVLNGSAAVVAAFLGGWAAEAGLVELYGDAARGFAGGYEPRG